MALVMRYYFGHELRRIADALGVAAGLCGRGAAAREHELAQALEGSSALAAGGASWSQIPER